MLEILKNIFNLNVVSATIRISTPILFVALGAVITQQANILNVGIEGIMLMGAFVAVLVSFFTGSWVLAILAAVFCGIILSIILGAAHIKFKADIFVVGMALNMFALASTRFALRRIFGVAGSFISDKIVPLPRFYFPFLERYPVLDKLFNRYSMFEFLGIFVVIFMWYILYKTVWGLHTRSVGLNEKAAESAGINVEKRKYEVIIYSGILAGLAGAHLALGYSTLFVENMTNGRGFMGVAAMYFGGANPVLTYVGTLLLGFSGAVGNVLQIYSIPSQFVLMLPYIITIAVFSITLYRRILKEKKDSRVEGAK
ncbi:nucleoside ABC transporter membrane protein [Clostridium aceticum]|uniref:Nucleoside ABC transporter membrane protein n=1 Tax=Clostridium aceticum TaxID=84022 RepID=A0A0D8ICC9_9CLOT|nr:ABC transporter permease [Clostridium aceticum]AKL94823.1 nucleoside ABC transporter membrane protein [Clostridium aceticum]KJF27759.1 ABC transporter permease [Clostridium aceticum]